MGRKRALAGQEKEVVRLWESGMGIYDIGKRLGVAGSTVGLELERLDLRERPTKDRVESHFRKIKDTDEFSYVLGVIWAIGSLIGDKFVIRHRDKAIIDKICNVLKYVSGPYKVTDKKDQWACHFNIKHPMFQYMKELGWTGRWDKNRKYSNGDVNHDEFIRGFVTQHMTVDMAKNKKRKFKRVRIYGALHILETINDFFVEKLGLSPKKIQNHGKSEVMKEIYYTSKKEVPVILNFLGME